MLSAILTLLFLIFTALASLLLVCPFDHSCDIFFLFLDELFHLAFDSITFSFGRADPFLPFSFIFLEQLCQFCLIERDASLVSFLVLHEDSTWLRFLSDQSVCLTHDLINFFHLGSELDFDCLDLGQVALSFRNIRSFTVYIPLCSRDQLLFEFFFLIEQTTKEALLLLWLLNLRHSMKFKFK